MRFVLRSRVKLDAPSEKPRAVVKSIIHYTTKEKPRNDYPTRIVSPVSPSECCTPENRVRVGEVKDVEGLRFFYRMCRVCGHTVKFFLNPQYQTQSRELKKYLRWRNRRYR